MVSAVACGYRSIMHRQAGDNEYDRARKKDMMVFPHSTKFIVYLNPGCCSLGAEGSNERRVEVTP